MLQKILLKSLDHLLAMGASRGVKSPIHQTGEHPPVEPKNLLTDLSSYTSASEPITEQNDTSNNSTTAK